MTDDLTLISDGFTAADFEAYQSSKWSSNMFTLQRRAVKDKLQKTGRLLTPLFEQAGLQLISHISDEYPSLWNKKRVDRQWLFFSRDLSAKKELQDIIDTEKTLAETLVDPTPLYKHIFVGVSVNETHLEAGIRLHFDAWVDRKNLLALLQTRETASKLITLCRELPDDYQFGIFKQDTFESADFTVEGLQDFVNRFNTGGGWMFLGKKITASDAAAAGSAIQQQIIDIVSKIIPLYRFMAWSPENDAVSLDSIVLQKQKQREEKHQVLEQERQQWEENHKETVAKRQAEKEARKQEMLEEQGWREQERAKRRALAASKRAAAEAAWNKNMYQAKSGRTGELSSSTAGAPADTASRATAEQSRTQQSAPRADKNSYKDRESEKSSRNNSARRSFKKHEKHSNTGRQHSGKSKSGSFPSSAKNIKPSQVSQERKNNIQTGDKVKVTAGFLNNRTGIVQSIDEKGDLIVSFGMLSSRVLKKDVQGLGPAV
jgi:hypothetical protein